MKKKIKQIYKGNPLLVILILAFIFRILAAIFSKGFAMFDDHFLVIEPAQNWADGGDDWFKTGKPAGHSLVYPGLHFLLFGFLQKFGIIDPQIKMYVVRFIHAIYSLLVVYFGYRITENLINRQIAGQVGLILAMFWILPFMSVRNLIEMICIPPMMAGYFLITLTKKKKNLNLWILTGILFGLAFAFRYQTLLITGGLGFVILIRREFKPFFSYSLGFIVGAFLVQGMVDWIFWDYPFASFYRYVEYNATHARAYTTGPWYQYIVLILGVLIPPTSLLLFYGFLRTVRKYEYMFFPTFLFLFFHSLFPNKQERFILSILPFVIILCLIGWNEYYAQSDFWQKRKKLFKRMWYWFWAVNTILLLIVSFTYSKKSRVETLTYLSRQANVSGVIVENYKNKVPRPPEFYLNKDVPVFRLPASKTKAELLEEIDKSNADFANYIIFLGEKGINDRIERFESTFKKSLKFLDRINPSLIDDILYFLNPKHNVNQTSYIYKIDPIDWSNHD